jgi:hypothetical protein
MSADLADSLHTPRAQLYDDAARRSAASMPQQVRFFFTYTRRLA